MTTMEVAEFGIKTVSAIAEAKLDAKNAEIARLRQALEHIANWTGGSEWPMEIARKVLSANEEVQPQKEVRHG